MFILASLMCPAPRTSAQAREPWEWRSALVYHLEFAADLTLHCLTMCHYLHLWSLHGLQLQLLDGMLLLDVRLLLGAIRRRLRNHAAYRRLQRRLHSSFADAAPEQLGESRCCICLDAMKVGAGHSVCVLLRL
jgi:autocrine motility factor receptor